MPELTFSKMSGAGNDFIVFNNLQGEIRLTARDIQKLCERRTGVGADGVLALEASDTADFRMRYYNADGLEADMCGNGARCIARYASSIGIVDKSLTIATRDGILNAVVADEQVTLGMPDPHDMRLGLTLKLSATNNTITGAHINTGVAHFVTWVPDLDSVAIELSGKEIRAHPEFAPEGVNANFVAVKEPGLISLRTYERGVEAETLACGTGAVAAALLTALRENWNTSIGVNVRSNDLLTIGFQRDKDTFKNITLTGPAVFVFEGKAHLL